MKLVHQYFAIFFTFSPTSYNLHPPQVENCDSNSRLVVDGDDNDKFRLERVQHGYGCYPDLLYHTELITVVGIYRYSSLGEA